MRSYRSRDPRAGVGLLKQDTGLYEHGVPTDAAISRWENEGGAPDRRGEFGIQSAVKCIGAISASRMRRGTPD